MRHKDSYSAVIVAPDGKMMGWTVRPQAYLAKRAARMNGKVWAYAQSQGYRLARIKNDAQVTESSRPNRSVS